LSGVHQLVEFDLEADALTEARASSCTPIEGEKIRGLKGLREEIESSVFG
jgi:hypothetical protein